MVYSVLAVWTLALIQFPFVVTVTRGGDAQNNVVDLDDVEELDDEEQQKKTRKSCYMFCTGFLETEVWGIVVSVFMQDGPFFILRVVAIFMYDLVTYTNYFFTAKNGLILFLQLYRVISLCAEHKSEKEKEEKEKKERVKQLWKVVSDV